MMESNVKEFQKLLEKLRSKSDSAPSLEEITREVEIVRKERYRSKKQKEKKMEDMKEVILEYVIEEYLEDEDEELTYDTPLISGGIVDSFSMVSLKRFLENKYKISIPDEKASPEAFDTVDKIVELVKEFTG